MNITKDIITDLFPLYLENECSPDTRALVEEYLRQNPEQADALRRVAAVPLPSPLPAAGNLGEAKSLQEARRRVRRRSWLMALAICFSLTPFSLFIGDGHSWWMLRDAPKSAAIYAVLAAMCWICYAVEHRRCKCL